MLVQGSDCSIVIKTNHREMDVPYSEETLREAVSLLEEEASIEGDGHCRTIRKPNGTTGCIITPLTIETTPLLFYLAMGSAGKPVFISETRNLYRYDIDLLPLEDAGKFDLIQDRGGERMLFEGCRVNGFEVRIMREEAIKLKLGICGECYPVIYPYKDSVEKETGERFSGNNVTYKINGQVNLNIYGITLVSKKENGTKTEIWIKRALNEGPALPHIIDDFSITAQLQRDKFESRYFGIFRITIKRLVLNCDETNINSADTVIGPLRYYVADTVTVEVFTNNEQ